MVFHGGEKSTWQPAGWPQPPPSAAPFSGDLAAVTWNTQALFARKRGRHVCKDLTIGTWWLLAQTKRQGNHMRG